MGTQPQEFWKSADSSLFSYRDTKEGKPGSITTLGQLSVEILEYGLNFIDPALISFSLQHAITNDITGRKPPTPQQEEQIRSTLLDAIAGRRPDTEILRDEIDTAIKHISRLSSSSAQEDKKLLESARKSGRQYLDEYDKNHN